MSELINKFYKEAVSGIKQEWLSDSSSSWYDYVTSLPTHLQVVYMMLIFHNQVFNGGIHQYFTNRYGQFVEKTIEYLRLINAKNKADILGAAFHTVNYENLDIESFRYALMRGEIEKLFVTDELFDPLDELDEKYDESDEDVEVLLNQYLEKVD